VTRRIIADVTPTSPATRWANWARTEHANPQHVVRPADLGGVVRVIQRRGGLTVRVVGAGHSFTGAAATDGIVVNLDGITQVERVVPQHDGTTQVTVGAGIRLRELNQVLDACGLAMRNLGSIDRQSIAGAISTGTHGTGIKLGGLASQVVGLRVVTADGAVRDVDAHRDGDLFQAARLGLGAVGIIVAVTLETVPAFTLEAHEETLPLDHVLASLDGPDGLVDGNDHVELLWYPHTRRAVTKRSNTVDADAPDIAPPLGPLRHWVDDELLANGVFAVANELTAAARALTPMINQVAVRAQGSRAFSAPSHRVFVTPNRVRCREMEYAVPRAALPAMLAAVDRWIQRNGEQVSFPVQVRFAAADDVWLSTAYGRETAYIAVRQYAKVPCRRYFSAVERIMAEVDGRPHWGMLNWLRADRFAELYPRFEDFRAVRSAHDPDGVFSNPYTERVFGRRG
jgi:FAD-linked oxidoreductase